MWAGSGKNMTIGTVVLMLLLMPGLSIGNQDAEGSAVVPLAEMSNDEIGMELFNPVTSMVSIKTDFAYRSYQGSLPGAGDESAYNANIQPTFPIPLDNGKNILLGFTIPIYGNQPIYDIHNGSNDPDFPEDKEFSPFMIRQIANIIPRDGSFDNDHGHDYLGDIGFNIAYGGVSDNGFISMYGAAFAFPTSQDISQRRQQYLAGPEIALGKLTGWGIYGARLSHLTRVSGEKTWGTNMTTLKIFFAYGLGNGWQIFSNPVMAYDWEGESGNKLFLPLGAGIAKTTRFGRVPLKLAFEIQKYIASPDSIGPDWMLTFSMTPVFSNPLLK